MDVNAADRIVRPEGAVKAGSAGKAETSDDFFKVLLQMLAQCVLGAKGMPLQKAQAVSEDETPDGGQGLRGASLSGAADPSASPGIGWGMGAGPVIRCAGGGFSCMISASEKGAPDERAGAEDTADIKSAIDPKNAADTKVAADPKDAVDPKNAADTKVAADAEDVKQRVSNILDAMGLDKAPEKLMSAVRATPAGGNAGADVLGAGEPKEGPGNETSSGKPAAVQEAASPSRDVGSETGKDNPKLDAAADGNGDMRMRVPQKTARAAAGDGASQTAVKDLKGDMKLTGLKFSGEKDEGFRSGGDGSDRKDDDISTGSGAAVFPEDEVSKPFTVPDGESVQQGVEKQPVRIDKDDILSQVYDRIKVFREDGLSELRVSLKPDQLGEVSIKLVMEKGVINARVTVENPEIKSIMQRSIPEIKEHLQEQEINISNLSVCVGEDRGGSDGGGGLQGHEWRRPKKAQPHRSASADALAVRNAPYYGGVLNLLA